MASVKSDVVTLLDSLDQSVRYVDVSVLRARLRVAAFYVNVNAVAAGETIDLVRLPAGARVLAIVMANGASGSGDDIQIGDSADADRLVDALSIATASTMRLLPLREEAAALASKTLGFGYKYTAETTIQAGPESADVLGNVALQGFFVYTVD